MLMGILALVLVAASVVLLVAALLTALVGLIFKYRWKKWALGMIITAVLCLGLGVWQGVRATSEVRAWFANWVAEQKPSEEKMRGWYQTTTGNRLPVEAQIEDGRGVTLFPFSTFYLKMRAEPQTLIEMTRGFREMPWEEAQRLLEEHMKVPLWDFESLRGKRYFQRTWQLQGDAYLNLLVYDEKENRVLYAGVQMRD
jgi:hypothetical protein